MESDTIESSSESKFPLIAGIAGVALGVVALILAVKAKGAADAAAAAAAAAESAAAASAAVGSKADTAALAAVSAEVTALREQTIGGFKQVETAIVDLQKRGTSTRGSSSAPAQVAADGEYIVVKGDTLSGIARKVGVSLKALQDLNPGVGNALRIGQKLKTK